MAFLHELQSSRIERVRLHITPYFCYILSILQQSTHMRSLIRSILKKLSIENMVSMYISIWGLFGSASTTYFSENVEKSCERSAM